MSIWHHVYRYGGLGRDLLSDTLVLLLWYWFWPVADRLGRPSGKPPKRRTALNGRIRGRLIAFLPFGLLKTAGSRPI